MMNTTIRFSKLTLLLLFLLLFSNAIAEPMKASISVDGGAPFTTFVIFPNKQTYVEVRALAKAMNWSVVNQQKAILLNRKRLSDLKEYGRHTYVSADELASVFNYRLDSREQGQVLNYFSKSRTAAGGQVKDVGITVLKRRKGTNPDPKTKTMNLTVRLKNPNDKILQIRASQFQLVDSKGVAYPCEGSFSIVLQPKSTQEVEGLFFMLPRQATEKQLRLFGAQKKLIGTGRI